MGNQCKLSPVVTLAKEGARLDSAASLIAAIEVLEAKSNPGKTGIPMGPALRGESIAFAGPHVSAIQTYPGKAVVVDGTVAGQLAIYKMIAGHMDDNSALVLQAPAPTSTATALTGEWWHQPGLLATSPQGTITAAGRDAAGNCRINQNNKPLVAVPAGSVILTDTTRAFAVLADCKVEPLITLPQASAGSGSVSVAGGGIRNPGPISPGPNPGVGQAGLPLLAFAATPQGEALIGGGLVALGITIKNTWYLLNGTAVTTGPGAARTLANRQGSGLTAAELGVRTASIIAEVSSPIGPPDGPEEWHTNNWQRNGEDEELPKSYKFERGSLQHGYDRHGQQWGFNGPQNNQNLKLFQEKLAQHMNSPSTKVIRGYYKNQRMIAFVNTETKMHVGFKPDGHFWTSFELSDTQLRGLITIGRFAQFADTKKFAHHMSKGQTLCLT